MTTQNQVITLSDGVIYAKFVGYSCLKFGSWNPVSDQLVKRALRIEFNDRSNRLYGAGWLTIQMVCQTARMDLERQNLEALRVISAM